MCFESRTSQAIDQNALGIPPPTALGEDPLPYVIVADDAFPLKMNIIKPYPFRGLSRERRITNYRIYRARRVSENAFGIMANRFRVFLSPIQVSVENAEKITLASCVLHNFLRQRIPENYSPPGSFDTENFANGTVQDGEWRIRVEAARMQPLFGTRNNNYTINAKEVCDRYCAYFNSDAGAVPWQDRFS